MKKIYLLLILLLPVGLFGQTIFAYTDFNNFFDVFRDGYFSRIEHNAVADVTHGDEFIAYTNSQRDFKVYNGDNTELITNQVVQFKMSDHILVWNIGPIINYYENNVKHTLTSYGGEYLVGDSIIVYEDTRYNTVNAVYKGQVTQLYALIDSLYMPEAVGDNIVAFRDNGNNYKVFWRGKIYELGVWNGSSMKLVFSAGTDMLAFNDPNSRTFAIFEGGEFKDVEEIWVNKYVSGRGFLVYEDVQGNLKWYSNGELKTLASFNQFWDVKDDVVIWGEANATWTLTKKERKQVANYKVTDYQIHNDVIAFVNTMSGISANIAGVTHEITTLPNGDYMLNNHSVLVKLANRSVLVYFNGKTYNDI